MLKIQGESCGGCNCNSCRMSDGSCGCVSCATGGQKCVREVAAALRTTVCGSCDEHACKRSGGECITCKDGGQICMGGAAQVVHSPSQPYSNLGGVVAPRGSAYIMPSMANPNAERPRKRLNAQIPSQTDLGGVGNMESFNPYNTLGTYRNGVNTMINTQELPRTYGGGFYTNVNLENPTGSPIVPPIGGGGTEWKKTCGRKKCTERRGLFRKAKDWCHGTPPDRCSCLGHPCGPSAMVVPTGNNYGW